MRPSSVRRAMRRRTFVALVAAGGALQLAFGARDSSAPAQGSFAPNAWLRIDPDERITIAINKAEMGQGVTTGLATILADELDASLDRVAVEFAPAEPRFNDPTSGVMSTGGSTSIRNMWMPMRIAGASARAMLIAAAAQRWHVDPRDCTTQEGMVVHWASHRTATYGRLVAEASAQPVPTDPPLKARSQWTLIGKHNARIDIVAKLDGSAGFGIDVKVPSMLHATVLRCPVFGGKVVSFDPGDARKIKGVRGVLRIASGVAIVADNTWIAFQARPAIHVTWDFGTNAQLDTAALFAEAEQLSKGPVTTAKRIGNPAAVNGTAIEASYRGPFLAHATMEPMNATADVRSDRCEVWAPTQVPTASRLVAQRLTGLPLENITIHTTYLGGGFGRRLQTDFIADAVELSKALGKPVQVVWTREDDIQHDFYRPMSFNAVRGVIDRSGKLIAFSHTVVSPAEMRGALNGAESLYVIPNLELGYVRQDRGIPIGAWRAPGANWNVFVVESFVDELAHAAKRDPLAFRLEMLRENPRAAGVLTLAAQNAGWGKPLMQGHAHGLAVGFWNGSYGALIADVGLVDGAPRVYRATVAVDCGTIVNPDIVRAQAQSGVAYGLAAALTSKITIKEGRVEQRNFNDYVVLRYTDAPSVDVHFAPSTAAPTGIGELATPLIAPAVANAVFALMGKRAHSLPLNEALRS